MSLKSRATTFTHSYATAMSLLSPSSTSKSPPATLPECAAALASHYGPGMTSFALGSTIFLAGGAAATAAVEAHLNRFEACGLGCDIGMVEHEVLVVSEGSALCFVTWEIRPREGEGWRWRNVYGYRAVEGGEGYWEFSVSDEEVRGLVERVPGFFGG